MFTYLYTFQTITVAFVIGHMHQCTVQTECMVVAITWLFLGASMVVIKECAHKCSLMRIQTDHLHGLTTVGPPIPDIQMGKQLS